MRPLWRNLLWLGLAAACGAVGVWKGFDWGAQVTWKLSFQNRVSDDFWRARQALETLADRHSGNRQYAESNLRHALADIGKFHETWMSCFPRDKQTLAAAALYLRRNPSMAAPETRKALAACAVEGTTPAPPIADGKYRFELRDPEFPQAEPIPTRATVDARHIVFETDEASSRFPKGTRFEGELTWRAAEGKWVLVSDPAEAQAKEIGGCSDGPQVVDLEHLIFWFC